MRPVAGRDAPELEQRVRRALRRADRVLRRTAGAPPAGHGEPPGAGLAAAGDGCR